MAPESTHTGMAQISAIKPAGQIIPKWHPIIDWLLRWRLVEQYVDVPRLYLLCSSGPLFERKQPTFSNFFVCVCAARCNNKQPPWRSERRCRCCYHYYFLLWLKRVDWNSHLMTSAETLAYTHTSYTTPAGSLSSLVVGMRRNTNYCQRARVACFVFVSQGNGVKTQLQLTSFI